MIRTYYVEMEASIGAYGEAWVEVEEVLDSSGNVDEAATRNEAQRLAMRDVVEDRIDWDVDGNVSDVVMTNCERDD